MKHNPKRMCEGKRVYFDELSAKCTIIRLLEKGTNTNYLRTYKCPRCKFWHLTKKKIPDDIDLNFENELHKKFKDYPELLKLPRTKKLAKETKEKLYFNGKLCKKGHVCGKYTTGTCEFCFKELNY